jgi:hypothetical protein
MEEWRHVRDFERYEISNLGNVRRQSHILNPGLDTDGYRQVNLYRDGSRFCRKVYRLVLDAFSPNINNLPQIDHINRVRTDDRLENLRWVTASENIRNSKKFTEEMLGISWNKKNSTYIVRLKINGKVDCYFGSYITLDEAKQIRDKALNNEITFVPQKKRESYGISLLTKSGKYQVQLHGKKIGYTATFEEAKHLRDSFNASNA